MRKLISIVIPAYNEEEVLGELEKRLKAVANANSGYNFEIIIVENGSFDSSFEKLLEMNREDKRFKVVQLSRNFGCDGGITAGLSYARGDAAVIMNADLQDPPEMIAQFIKKWEEGYDVVYGIIKKREGVSLTRKLLSALAYRIIYYSTSSTMPKDASDFRLMDRRVYTVVNGIQEKNRYLRGIVAWTGFNQIGIPYERPPGLRARPKQGSSQQPTWASMGSSLLLRSPAAGHDPGVSCLFELLYHDLRRAWAVPHVRQSRPRIYHNHHSDSLPLWHFVLPAWPDGNIHGQDLR
jgi:glycosyltransferase involved in cell wall biosynthesis